MPKEVEGLPIYSAYKQRSFISSSNGVGDLSENNN